MPTHCQPFTQLPDVWLLTPQPIADERGSFTTLWDAEGLAANGLHTQWVQANRSTNVHTGTLRGLHYQLPPHGEAKLVRCAVGSIWDVAVDIRPNSPTFKHWVGAELTAASQRMLYLPTGFAHGFITLQPHTVVEYMVSSLYAPQHARSLHWNDPDLAIQWPGAATTLSDKDKNAPALAALQAELAEAFN